MFKIKHCVALLGTLLLGMLFVGCNEYEKDLSDIAIMITPNKTEKIELASGDKVKYSLDFYTTHESISRFSVVSFDAQYGETVLIDSLCNQSIKKFDFVYAAPMIDRDSLIVELNFYAWDNLGNQCMVERSVVVKSKMVLLPEKSGIVLWRGETGRPDALCFADPSKVFHKNNKADSLSVDMFIDADEEFGCVNLESETNAKFVRYNNFDYAAASVSSIAAVYKSSQKSASVSDLQINDIVLVGHDEKAQGAFRVLNIIRSSSSPMDCCVQLAFKEVKTIL